MSTHKPLVLIVDDDTDLADVMRLTLGRAGFEVHAEYSGQAALAWLAHSTADVVLLDLMMTDMNGFALLRQLRAGEATNPLPVIIVTARADHASRAETAAAGASAFLTKPVQAKVLVEHVRQALAGRESAA
jgi:DNA-binding response OmpR family regulator